MFLKTNIQDVTFYEFDSLGSIKKVEFLQTDDAEIHLYKLDNTREYYIDMLIKKDKRINVFDKEKLWFLISKIINAKINEYISNRILDTISCYLPQEDGISAFFIYKNYVINFFDDSVYKFNGVSLSKKKIGKVQEILNTLNIKEDDLKDIIVFFNHKLIKEEIANSNKEMRTISKNVLKDYIVNIVSSYLSMDCFSEEIEYFMEDITQKEIDEFVLKRLTYDEISKIL